MDQGSLVRHGSSGTLAAFVSAGLDTGGGVCAVLLLDQGSFMVHGSTGTLPVDMSSGICTRCGLFATVLPDQGSFTVHGSKGTLSVFLAADLCTGFGATAVVVDMCWFCGKLFCIFAPLGFPSSVGSAWRSGIALPVGAGGGAAQFLMG